MKRARRGCRTSYKAGQVPQIVESGNHREDGSMLAFTMLYFPLGKFMVKNAGTQPARACFQKALAGRKVSAKRPAFYSK